MFKLTEHEYIILCDFILEKDTAAPAIHTYMGPI